MGFFSRLANKVGGAVRFGVKHSESIGRLAHKVGSVASRVGSVATGVAAAMAGNPIGAVAGGIAGAAKGVGKVAGVVGSVADKVSSMKSTFGGANTANAASAGAVRMLGGGVPQLQLGN